MTMTSVRKSTGDEESRRKRNECVARDAGAERVARYARKCEACASVALSCQHV
jgi:hypothetical protein